MPAISFQSRFVRLIESGEKWFTIRQQRKRPFKKGDRLVLYENQRSVNCRLIKETVCTFVADIKIAPPVMLVQINGQVLSQSNIENVALADGFKSAEEFFEFFGKHNMSGQLIAWENKPLTEVYKWWINGC